MPKNVFDPKDLDLAQKIRDWKAAETPIDKKSTAQRIFNYLEANHPESNPAGILRSHGLMSREELTTFKNDRNAEIAKVIHIKTLLPAN